MSGFRSVFIASLLAVAGCSSAEGADKSDVATSYESELRVTGPTYLGTISSGDTKTSYYSDPPKYRAYGFQAKGGDQITIDVSSEDGGDAIAWLTDSSYSDTYASNDDASSKTLDSHIEYTVPDGTPTTDYRIVFRDYDRLDATFTVSLDIKSSSPSTSCDPSDEPWRDYLYTPAQCASVRYTCPSGSHAFQNACGCGCE